GDVSVLVRFLSMETRIVAAEPTAGALTISESTGALAYTFSASKVKLPSPLYGPAAVGGSKLGVCVIVSATIGGSGRGRTRRARSSVVPGLSYSWVSPLPFSLTIYKP